MDIELDNGYGIVSDTYGCSIFQKQIVKKGKSAEKECRRFIGHYRNPEDAFNGLLDYHLRASDAKSIEQVLESISEVREVISKAVVR